MAIEMESIINEFLEGSIKTVGKVPVINELNVSENGTYTAPSGVDGYSPVKVNIPDPVLSKLNVSSNGTYTPPSGTDGYDEVVVNVPISVFDELSVTENGTYTPPSGVDGYDEVTVNVQPTLDELSVTENGTYTPPSGTDGYDEVVVNVQPTLDELTVTQNGTYTPPTGVDGYDEVTVNVEGVDVLLDDGVVLNGYTNPNTLYFNGFTLASGYYLFNFKNTYRDSYTNNVVYFDGSSFSLTDYVLGGDHFNITVYNDRVYASMINGYPRATLNMSIVKIPSGGIYS